MSPVSSGTFVDALEERTLDRESAVSLTVLDSEINEQAQISRGALIERAKGVAAFLQRHRAKGERVAVAATSLIEYVEGVLGSLYAGAVAVPCFPANSRRHIQTLETLIQQTSAKFIVASRMTRASPILARLEAQAQIVIPSEVPSNQAAEWRMPNARADDLAILQFTSGSTTAPRGSMITHRNLMCNQGAIDQAFRLTDDSTVLSWLPLHHDMGLIGGLLHPLFRGARCVLMPPGGFLQDPTRWIAAIAKYRADVSGGPNFAFEYCIGRSPQHHGQAIDLTSWRIAFVGAEPVRKHTLERFADSFGQYGFRKSSFLACYGLSEATLLVSAAGGGNGPTFRSIDELELAQGRFIPSGEATIRSRSLVGAGRPIDCDVVIVEPESQVAVDPGQVGEVWIAGDSVAAGYWKSVGIKQETSTGQLELVGKKFLRTGDLGAVFDDELFILGRLKELIIFRGQNYYPDDIEETVRKRCPHLRPQSTAAISCDIDGEERLVVIQEVKRMDEPEFRTLGETIVAGLSDALSIIPDLVWFVPNYSIPKTTSGKIQRRLCADAVANTAQTLFRVLWSWQPRLRPADRTLTPKPTEGSDIRETLRALTSDVLNVDASLLSDSAPIVSLGCDSLRAVTLIAHIRNSFAVEIPIEAILGDATLDDVTRTIVQRSNRDWSHRSPEPTQHSEISDSIPSLEQTRLWTARQVRYSGPELNLQVACRIEGHLDFALLSRCFKEVLDCHSELTCRFEWRDGRIVKEQSGADERAHLIEDAVEGNGDVPVQEAVDKWLLAQLEDPFNLQRGQLCRARLLVINAHSHALAITADHIVADAKSLMIVLTDLWQRYSENTLGRSSIGPLRRSRLAQLVAAQQEYVSSVAGRDDLAFWIDHLAKNNSRIRSRKSSTIARHFWFSLSDTERALVRSVSATLPYTLFTLLLAPFLVLLRARQDSDQISVMIPTAGRFEERFSDVVGLLAYPMLVNFTIKAGCPPSKILHDMKSALLDCYSHQKLPFAAIVEAIERRGNGATVEVPQILVTALPPRSGVPQIPGLTVSQLRSRPSTADVSLALTFDDAPEALECCLAYDASTYRPDEIVALSTAYRTELVRILNDALKGGEASPNSGMDQQTTAHRLALAATFVADPVKESLEFWIGRLDLRLDIATVEHQLPVRELLDRHGILANNLGGTNVLFLRVRDLFGAQGEGGPSNCPLNSAEIDRVVEEVVAAVRFSVECSRAQHIIFLCPENQANRRHDGESALSQNEIASRELRKALVDCDSVSVLDGGEVLSLYHVTNAHRLSGDQSSIPYTDEFFAALGTATMRQLVVAHKVRRPKVLVVDCDNTLWRGVCDESTPMGVTVPRVFWRFQNALLRMQATGTLVCICSKNADRDVHEVFDSHPAMVLRRMHVSAWRLGWNSKSQSIASLSRELGIALDDFVFIDDSSFECAEVQANTPSVRVCQFPEEDVDIEEFVNHCWFLDAVDATEEGARRSVMYREDAARTEYQATQKQLTDFVMGLQLVLTVRPACRNDIPRIAELSMRTNQFNNSGRRFSQSEVGRLMDDGSVSYQVISVKDRFGNYGLVGVIRVQFGVGLVVEELLLSCRAFGRGVEEEMLRVVGRVAADSGSHSVSVVYNRSGRNGKVGDLLSRHGGKFAVLEDGRPCVVVRTDRLLSATFDVGGDACVESDGSLSTGALAPEFRVRVPAVDKCSNARSILASMRRNINPRLSAAAYVAPSSEAEQLLADIVAEILALENVGANDSFVGLGGESLSALRLGAKVFDVFGVDYPLVDVFSPSATIAEMAKSIVAMQVQTPQAEQRERLLQFVSGLTEEETSRHLETLSHAGDINGLRSAEAE